eukprot:757468-Hanusia_phi.AAC.2
MLNNPQQGCFQFPGGELSPPSDVLSSIPLSKGKNLVEFHLADASSEPVACSASLWLLDVTDRLVVVDIDGTITRSDVRGLVASQLQGTASFLSNALSASNPWAPDLSAALSADYTHDGVREFLTAVSAAGYLLLFLTARPITLADRTRDFLATAGRAGDSTLPEGPLITQACGTMKALQTKHEVFKVAVLRQIHGLFERREEAGMQTEASKTGVFVAGFGNHETDAMAYKAVGIPPDKIFMLDKSSKLRIHGTRLEFQSYSGLLPDIQELFPPLSGEARKQQLLAARCFAPAYSSTLWSHSTVFEEKEPATHDPRASMLLNRPAAASAATPKAGAAGGRGEAASPPRRHEEPRAAEGWTTRNLVKEWMAGGLSDLSCTRAREGDARRAVQGKREGDTKPLPLAAPMNASTWGSGRAGKEGGGGRGGGSDGTYVHL